MADDVSQSAASSTRDVLAPEDSVRLIEFARACKAAARAVTLYPDAHPAIAATLGRIAQLTSAPMLTHPLTLTILPDSLLLNERMLPRPDAAVNELAAILHQHLIGQLVIQPGGDVTAWRNFMRMLGRSVESLRAEGGIARVWSTMAGGHVEIREIDYSEVLRERSSGDRASWDRVIANCLQGVQDLDDDDIRELLTVVDDSERFGEFLSALDKTPDNRGVGPKTAALLTLFRKLVERVGQTDPPKVESTLGNMASAVSRLSPEMLMSLLTQGQGAHDGGNIVEAVVNRMTDGTIAKFVARNVMADAPTDRLAQAFQTLVRDTDQRPRLLALARQDVAASPFGAGEGFEDAWNRITEKMLASYSDEPFVSADYSRELTSARTQALEVERAGEDPPERISTWLSTVATTALRGLDLALMLDLLRIEENDDRWGELTAPVVSLIEDLMLVGDFDAARQLLDVLINERSGTGSPARRQHATTAIDTLVEGSMLRHIATHLGTVDEAQFERVRTMCTSVGVVLVRPLAELLAVEERPRTRERLTAILVSFGSEARQTIERLKASTNPAVRRTAIYLMREFAGSDALPDLTELLDDNEPQVQREAVRAILTVGTDAAYETLQKALASGTERSREAIMQSISVIRDERAAPLFIYILRNVDHRGHLASIYVRAIESLGSLKDPEGIPALAEALHKGEWWAPGRTRALRTAAAAALARIGTDAAMNTLEEAATSGSRGVRNAARPQLVEAKRRVGRRGGQS